MWNYQNYKKSNLNEAEDVVSEKSFFDIIVENTNINLNHIASKVLEEQIEVCKDKENVELYKERIEKNKDLKKIYKSYDYNQTYIEWSKNISSSRKLRSKFVNVYLVYIDFTNIKDKISCNPK